MASFHSYHAAALGLRYIIFTIHVSNRRRPSNTDTLAFRCRSSYVILLHIVVRSCSVVFDLRTTGLRYSYSCCSVVV
jgi:hypothetical protein